MPSTLPPAARTAKYTFGTPDSRKRIEAGYIYFNMEVYQSFLLSHTLSYQNTSILLFEAALTFILFLEPIIPLPESEPRERTDTGVRFTQWGPTSDRLYTGSSDGIIKSWNVKRAAEDVLVADIANIRSIVMSGAFSPDSSRLLIGDGKGGIHVLTTGVDGDDSVERMEFEPAEKAEEDSFEGCEEADRLVASGEIIMHHGRPYQGPSYRSANARRQALREQLDLIYQEIHENQDSFDYSALDFDHPNSVMEVDKSGHIESYGDYDLMDLS
jgi:WD40 repeat protein